MDKTAVHCRVELFSDLDSVNNYLCFSDIFVVASEILSKQKISAVCPVSTRKPRTERFIFGDTINCDYMGKPSCHVSWGTVVSWSAFITRSGDTSRGLNIEDAISRGSSGGKSKALRFVRLYVLFHLFDLRQRLQTQVWLTIRVSSSNEKLWCQGEKKLHCNFNVRKRGTTTWEDVRTIDEVAMLMSPGWTKQLYIAGWNCFQS